MKFEEEDMSLILLNFVPESTLMWGKETLESEEIWLLLTFNQRKKASDGIS